MLHDSLRLNSLRRSPDDAMANIRGTLHGTARMWRPVVETLLGRAPFVVMDLQHVRPTVQARCSVRSVRLRALERNVVITDYATNVEAIELIVRGHGLLQNAMDVVRLASDENIAIAVLTHLAARSA